MPNWLTTLRKKVNEAVGRLDSLDTVEFTLSIEETFGIEFADRVAQQLKAPAMLTEWLCNEIGLTRPNEKAIRLLRKIATAENRPELTRELGRWHRVQIAAVVTRLLQDIGAKSFSDETPFTEIFSG
jgi:hypothetical protein